MSRSIADLASPDVAEQVRRNPVAVIPLGSVEQHGPHLPNGTDTFAAELIGRELAERLDALYVPAGPYGVTPIHAGHPGTITLSRATFEALLTEIGEELVRAGLRTLVLVNWHEGNVASMDAVATDLQDRHGVTVVSVQACYVAQALYADEGGELTHGGGIETVAVLAHDPDLARLDRVDEPARPPGAEALDAMRRSREVHGYITDVTELATDGWYGDPHWATAELAEDFTRRVTDEVVAAVEAVLAARRDR